MNGEIKYQSFKNYSWFSSLVTRGWIYTQEYWSRSVAGNKGRVPSAGQRHPRAPMTHGCRCRSAQRCSWTLHTLLCSTEDARILQTAKASKRHGPWKSSCWCISSIPAQTSRRLHASEQKAAKTTGQKSFLPQKCYFDCLNRSCELTIAELRTNPTMNKRVWCNTLLKQEKDTARHSVNPVWWECCPTQISVLQQNSKNQSYPCL